MEAGIDLSRSHQGRARRGFPCVSPGCIFGSAKVRSRSVLTRIFEFSKKILPMGGENKFGRFCGSLIQRQRCAHSESKRMDPINAFLPSRRGLSGVKADLK
jgi:hypothetical protein